MRRLARIFTLLAVVACFGAAVRAGIDDDKPQTESVRVARERWERLSPEEKERLRDRYERFLSMDEEQRQKLERRASSVREHTRRLERTLSPAERERVAALEPNRRREVMKEMVEIDLKNRWDRVREKMPGELVDKLESLGPEERKAELERFKEVQRERVSRQAIRELGATLGKSEEEIASLSELPAETRMEVVVDLRRQACKQRVRDFGLPEGLTQKRWDELLELPPDEFLEEIARIRADLLDRLDTEPGPDDAQRARLLRRLRETLRPDRGELLGLSHLPRGERRKALREHLRERALAVLAEHPDLVGGERLERLRTMPTDEFLKTVGEAVDREQRTLRRDVRPRRGNGAERGPGRGPGDGGQPERPGGRRGGPERGGRGDRDAGGGRDG